MNTVVKIERDRALDVAKGIGIFLVIFGHTCKQGSIVNYIYTFHVPLFFFLSGLLFRPDKYSGFADIIIKKAKGLLVPFAVLYVLSYAYWLLAERHFRSDSKGVDILEPLLGLLYGSDVKSFMIPNPPLWFLTCLFTSEVILYLSVRLTSSRTNPVYLFGFISIYAIVGYILSVFNVARLPLSFNSSLMALLIMGSAFIFKRLILKARSSLRPYSAFICALPLLCLVYMISSVNGYVDLNRNVYGNFMLYVLGMFSGSFAVFLLSVAIGKSSFWEYFGRNSLLAFAFSESIRRVVIFVYSKGLNETVENMRNSILLSILISITVLISMMPLIFVFNRYLGFLFGYSGNQSRHIISAGQQG